MVLGDGARDRGATADLISSDPATGAGVAFVRLEADPDPVRVRAAWVADADIRAMAERYRAVPDDRGGGRVNQPTTRWRTDDPCPVCGTGADRHRRRRRHDQRRTARCAAGRPPGPPARTEAAR